MTSKFEKKISYEFIKKHSASLLKDSYEQQSEYDAVCKEEGIDPELLRKIQLSDAKLIRLLYIAVQEYHNCLSLYLQEAGMTLPDLDSLFSYAEDRQA